MASEQNPVNELPYEQFEKEYNRVMTLLEATLERNAIFFGGENEADIEDLLQEMRLLVWEQLVVQSDVPIRPRCRTKALLVTRKKRRYDNFLRSQADNIRLLLHQEVCENPIDERDAERSLRIVRSDLAIEDSNVLSVRYGLGPFDSYLHNGYRIGYGYSHSQEKTAEITGHSRGGVGHILSRLHQELLRRLYTHYYGRPHKTIDDFKDPNLKDHPIVRRFAAELLAPFARPKKRFDK